MTTTTAPCSMATQSGTTRAPPCATSTRASTRTRSTRSSGDAGGSFRGASLSASALRRVAGPCAATGHGALMLLAQDVGIGRRRAGLTRATGAAPSPPGRARITALCDPHALSFSTLQLLRVVLGRTGRPACCSRSGAGRIAALLFSCCSLVNVCGRTIRGATGVHMLTVWHMFFDFVNQSPDDHKHTNSSSSSCSPSHGLPCNARARGTASKILPNTCTCVRCACKFAVFVGDLALSPDNQCYTSLRNSTDLLIAELRFGPDAPEAEG